MNETLKRLLFIVVALTLLIFATNYVFACPGGSLCGCGPVTAPEPPEVLVAPQDAVATMRFLAEEALAKSGEALATCERLGMKVGQQTFEKNDEKLSALMDDNYAKFQEASRLRSAAIGKMNAAHNDTLIADDAGDELRAAAAFADTLKIFDKVVEQAAEVLKELQDIETVLNAVET